jgi:predicted kinase
MEAVLFIGIQASGKSTFYKTYFFNTHVRINLDMLKSRHREHLLIEACLEAKQPYVVDNTNVTVEGRGKYIQRAHEAGFRVIGYYFRADLAGALRKNSERSGEACIPVKGVLATYRRLQIPSMEEGFDRLYYVRIEKPGEFVVEEWKEKRNNELSTGDCAHP